MQPQHEIQAELEQLGSTLATLPKLMPYTVPEGYFGQLPVQVLESLASERNIAALPKSNPFEVPANYFDGLPAQLLQKTKDEKNKSRTIPLWKTARLAAAAILLFAVGLGVFKSVAPTNSLEQQLDELPDEVVQEYVMQAGEETELQNSELALSANVAVNKLTDEEILQYLEETSWQ